jgi:hypothetical protein
MLVAEQWPALAAVEPTVTPWHGSAPSPRLMAQLGLAEPMAAAQPMQLPAYTFTFMAESRSPEGYPVAQVARVTVDSQQRVLKATVTK